MGDLVASWLSPRDLPAEQPERLQEERPDEVRLQPPRLGLFQFLADALDVSRREDVGEQRTLPQRLLQPLADRSVDDLVEPRPHLRTIPVTDRLDQQVPQRLTDEDLAEDVENLAAERLALLGELLE